MEKSQNSCVEASSNSLLDVLNNSLNGVTIATGFPPKIVLTNKALQKTFGYTDAELKGFSPKQLFNLIHPADRKLFFSRYKARLTGKSAPSIYKVRILNKKGEVCWVEIYSHRIIFNGALAIQTNYLDITQQYKALELQKNINDERSKILSNIDNAIVILDKQLKIIDVNKAYEHITGQKKRDLCGHDVKDFFDHIDPKSIGKINKIVKLALKGKKIAAEEVVLLFRNRRIIANFSVTYVKNFVNGESQIKYIIVSLKDITEEKKTLTQLGDKVSLIESILPAVHSGLLVIDNNGKVTLFNNTFLKLWRIPNRLAKLGEDKNLLKFVTKQLLDPKKFIARVIYLYSHPKEDSIDVIKFKDGRVFERVSHPQFKNDKIVGRVWNFYDKTSQYKEIFAREELMKKYEIATNVSGQIFYDYDINTGKIKWIGPLEKVLGYTKEEFKHIDIDAWSKLIHPEDRNKALSVLDKAAKAVGRYKCEYRFKIKDDGYAHMLDEGTFFRDKETSKIKMFGSMRDISELIIERAKAESLLQAMGDGVMAIDKHSKIIYVNKAAQEMLGFPAEKFIGASCSSFCSHHPGIRPNTDKDQCPTALARKLHKKVTITLKDNYYYTRADGTHFPVYISTSPVYIDGQDAGGILIFRDISDEKDIDKMKNEFISLASHQLRTPITSINWLSETLLDEKSGALSPSQRKIVEDIQTSNQHMTTLVDLLLTVMRLEMGNFPIEPKEIDLEDVCKSSLNELEGKIREKNINIETSCPNGLRKYSADPRIMNMIFQNILSNAVKYANKDSTIRIQGRLVDKELIISVSDQGIGIPMAQQSKIFTKLFRAENAQVVDTGGAGLGLYIIKSVVESVGGRIWFKSKENVGTTFFVALPAKGMERRTASK